MDWTNVYYRQLARLLSKHTWLYTEMVVDSTLIHNPQHDRFLWFPQTQHPIVCQLGGSNPDKLAQAAGVAARYGYDEINLNCGCPSDRVAGAGCFGAALMLQPELVADCSRAMADAVDTPITIKCRLGVDDVDSYPEMCRFIRAVSSRCSVTHFIIHSRKCMLKGLNPHQNRTIPPLRREWVYALKRDFPHLEFSLNGGILSAHQAADILQQTVAGGRASGVMIGRQAFYDPWGCLADADRSVFGAPANHATSRRQVLRDYGDWAEGMIGRWGTKPDGHRMPSVRALVTPLLNLFHGEKGSKRWKQEVDAALPSATSVRQLLQETTACLPPEVLDAPPREQSKYPAFSLQELPSPLVTDSAAPAGAQQMHQGLADSLPSSLPNSAPNSLTNSLPGGLPNGSVQAELSCELMFGSTSAAQHKDQERDEAQRTQQLNGLQQARVLSEPVAA